MTGDQALAAIEQEILDMMAEGMTSEMAEMNPAYVLASEYRKLLKPSTPSHVAEKLPPIMESCGGGGRNRKLGFGNQFPVSAPFAPSTTARSGVTPRTDAALDGWTDDIVKQSRLIPADAYAKVRDRSRELERELAVSFKRFDDLQAHYSNELTKLEGASVASAIPRKEEVIAHGTLKAWLEPHVKGLASEDLRPSLCALTERPGACSNVMTILEAALLHHNGHEIELVIRRADGGV